MPPNSMFLLLIDEYWVEISNHLCVPLRETGHSPKGVGIMVSHARKKAVINQWLELPTTKNKEKVHARIELVKALYTAGPKLITERIAQDLNINIQSMGTFYCA